MEGRTNEAVADLDKALQGGSSGGSYGSASSQGRRSWSEKQPRDVEGASCLKTPGGFRREHMRRKALEEGIAPQDQPLKWRQSLLEKLHALDRTGHLESALGIRLDPETGEEVGPTTRRAGRAQTLLALVKSFIGSGITFTPSAFDSGGWLVSSVLLVSIALTSFLGVHLLLKCREQTRTSSYGEIAAAAMGPRGKLMVQASLVLSQFGVCVALMMFVGELACSLGLQSARLAVMGQLVLLVPLCLVRSVQRLEVPNLVADLLILAGLGVVLHHHARLLLVRGVDTTVVACKPGTFGMSVGTLIYIFEGLPMVLPIRNSMKDAHENFLPLFSWVFFGVASFFLLFGMVGYLSLGETTRTVALLNLPRGTYVTIAVRSAYMLALILGLPLMFLPAARITELWAFGVTLHGQHSKARALLRIGQVFILAHLACWGGPYFDKILAIIGAICATPIAFIYPALFHLSLCASGSYEKALDIGCIGFGVVAAAATLVFL